MAKFLTITQRGFYFTVHDADKNIADRHLHAWFCLSCFNKVLS